MFMVCSSSSSTQVLILNSASPLNSLSHRRIYVPNSVTKAVGVRKRGRKWNMAVNNSGENNSITTTTTHFDDNKVVDSASKVVRNFYEGINAHDVDSVQYLISENCVYEDLVFPRPFVGRKEIIEFFKKFTDSTSKDLQFVIDDLSTEDSSSIGVIWHLEWKGKPFPFSKGCSFYRLEVINGKRQITLYSCWRLKIEKSSLWFKVLNSKYAFVESEIGTVGCLDSPWWRKIERLEKGVEGAISKHSSGKYTVKAAYRLLMSDFVRTGEKFNQINRYGRDCVEPAIKPGDATLAIIKSVTWLLQRFPQLADRL